MVKTVNDEQIAKNIIPTIIVNLSNDSYEEKIAEDILSNLKKNFVKNKENFSISHKILDFMTKREELEKAFNNFKSNNLKDTELLDSLISNASVLKDNGAYLLKEEISKEEYDRINFNIMYVEEIEEKMKKYRFILDESLGDFSRKF